MSLCPYLSDYGLPRWPRRILDQNFGSALTADDLLRAISAQFDSRIRPQWINENTTIKPEKDKFHINVDVQHFSPEEINVKIANGYIVVEGKHEEKKDEHGFISRQFIRKFKLPEDANADLVESRLSSDGVLTVLAPTKQECVKGERSVPITHTGPVRTEINDSQKPKEDKIEEEESVAGNF